MFGHDRYHLGSSYIDSKKMESDQEEIMIAGIAQSYFIAIFSDRIEKNR